MRFPYLTAAFLALGLTTACSSSNPKPDDSTTMAGDGDGDPTGDGDGDGDSGDGDPTTGDGDPTGDGDGDGDPMPDLPADGLDGCCICGPGGWCEEDSVNLPTEADCEAYGEAYASPWEWHAGGCYYPPGDNLACPGSCVDR